MSSFRLYRIVKTFLNFGLDELLPKKSIPWYVKCARLSLFWLRNKHKDKVLALRFRLAIESLGPVFIKFGQMLSTRRDLLPDDFSNELALLQDQVTAFDGEIAQQLIIDAIGKDEFSQSFENFDLMPLASASIAQVHIATMLQDGEAKQVVIKVLRPNIERVIHADMKVMAMFAGIFSRWLPDGKRLRPKEVVAEYKKTILDELDLNREAANAIQLKRNFSQGRKNDHVLYVPEIYSEFSSKNVLVMERIYGIGVADVEALHKLDVDMKLLAERGVEVFFTQVFRDSFFHADMHPGNVFVNATNPADPTWIAIDCGIVGTLNRDDKRYLAENFVAFFNRDYRKVAQLHVDSGWVPAETSVDEFEFGTIIPSTSNLRDRLYMDENGWFPELDADGNPNLSNIVVTYNHLAWQPDDPNTPDTDEKSINYGNPPTISCNMLLDVSCTGMYNLPIVGDVVRTGQTLGQTGATSTNMTFDHLHMSVFLARGFARESVSDNAFYLNPMLMYTSDIVEMHYFQNYFPYILGLSDTVSGPDILEDSEGNPLGISPIDVRKFAAGGWNSQPDGDSITNTFWTVQELIPEGPNNVEWSTDNYPLTPANDDSVITDIIEYLNQSVTNFPYVYPNCTLAIDTTRTPARDIANCDLSDLDDESSNFIDLNFGSSLGNKIQFDKALDKFIINNDVVKLLKM